jgi:ubiquinone/menaquinone biosynthesis C-methylase UbiE
MDNTKNTNRLFEGLIGRLTAIDMARRNRPAEHEAIEILNPAKVSKVLVVGCGPGIGVEALAASVPSGNVVAVDPSTVMCALTSKRCATAIATGHTTVVCGTVRDLPAQHGGFDGLIAVNSLQLCNPLPETAVVLGRALRPGGKVVAMTHDWAMRKHFGSVENAIATWTESLEQAGFVDFQTYPGRAEKGRSIVFCCSRQ